MSKTTPHVIKYDTAKPDNLGFATVETNGQKFVRIGYTDGGCPGVFATTAPAMKLVKVTEKDEVVTATFNIGSVSFAAAMQRVIDERIKEFIIKNNKKLQTKSKYYTPFLFVDKQNGKCIKLDVTSSTIYNGKGELDTEIKLSNSIGKFFRAYFVINGITRADPGYKVSAVAPQLKLVDEEYVDSRPDAECGYVTAAESRQKSQAVLDNDE